MENTSAPLVEDQPLYLQNLAPRPLNDLERIEALMRYSILDTPPEKEYDEITLLASEICQTPISSIGFIDSNRQVLKSNRGLSDVSPRDMTFCNHTINTKDILVIPDSRVDKRFTDHPAVVNDPHVIFYAGVPLVTVDGFALGTLCVVDNKPRELNERQLELLKALANQVMKLLDLRKNNMELATIGQQLQLQTIELKETNKELESFSYTVSHDLQSPLRTISGFSKFLLRGYHDKLDDEGKELLMVMDTNVMRMSELIKDLLKFSKLGKTGLVKKDFNMDDMVREIVDETKFATNNMTTEVKIESLENVACDPGLMRQVWANLIGNAVKYSSKKNKPVVEIGMQKVNGQTIYYVKDNGAGFDMKHSAERLFGVFQRMHHDDDFEGTGVGLATVQRIINRHGGRVWADAELHKGATFFFTLSQTHLTE